MLRASINLRHDTLRQLNLSQSIPREERPQTELKMPFWHPAASNDCFMTQCVN
jgi:hypothetical protein